ncbi:hypothetical protein CkaCkLH20_03074 [Colletotrichum karsti]|uniref:Uncharacterized protein n=1 Tax=Colletotrichum karsti TaxID=1095194 RepID=A0A9P6IFD9_9PEZI|nr:uncharacterized protein CkaCkLH20_03074 [Colletotrichum karsti]KAF9879531.1 hypothetical protein CkaCkLH20_03074 [Colletotrichum karsti]
METFNARTLEDMSAAAKPPNHYFRRFGDLFLAMIRTGYHKWGFVIYRCAYGDDDLWNRYMAQLKENIHSELVRAERAEILEKYLQWDVIEDRDSLDNASKADVRRHFAGWVSEHIANQPCESVKTPLIAERIARFRYCLYVDQKCLDTLEQFQNSEGDFVGQIAQYSRPPMVIVLVDSQWTPSRKGVPKKDRGFPPIEGTDKRNVGWLYTRALDLTSFYDELSQNYGVVDFDDFYARPPIISPGFSGLSMPE